MAVFRVERNKGYTVMSNHHLRNKELSLKAKGLLSQMLSLPEDWDYNFITILIATGVCALVAFLYYRFCYDSFKKLLHRQKLARMILENKWYEADTVQDSGFFTDLQSRSREKIVWFPKIYYQMEKGLLHIRCEITLGKYQDQLLRLEDKLESGLYCELTDKTLHDGYIEYTLLYDMIANRITIDEVRAENGSLTLTIREQQCRGNRDRPCRSSRICKPRGRGRQDQRGSRENRNRG